LSPHWIEINRLENDGDRVYRQTVADLFGGDYRARDVCAGRTSSTRWRRPSTASEDVADVLESIALKHS